MSVPPLHTKAAAACDAKRYAECVSLENQVIKAYPNYGYAYSYRGYALLELNRLSESLRDLNFAIKCNPDNGYAYGNRARCLLEMGGDAQQALTDAQKQVKLLPKLCLGHFYSSWAFLTLGRFQDALIEINKAAATIDGKTSSFVYNMRANIHNAIETDSIGSCKHAIDDYTRALALDKNNAWALANLAFMRYEVAMQQNGSSAVATIWIRGVQVQNKRFEAAKKEAQQGIADCEQALRLNVHCYHAAHVMGLFYFGLGQYTKARECFQQAIAISPALTSWSHNALGLVNGNERRWQEAVNCFDNAINLSRKAVFYTNKAWALNNMERYHDANITCQAALTIAGNNAVVLGLYHMCMAQALVGLKRPNDALVNLKFFSVKDDCYRSLLWRAFELKGDINRDAGNNEEALAAYTAAITVDDFPTGALHAKRSQIYTAMGNSDAAKKDMAMAMSLKPSLDLQSDSDSNIHGDKYRDVKQSTLKQ